MAELNQRIRIDARKAEALKKLVDGPDATYETYADALAHAAAKALAEGCSKPIEKQATQPEPIKVEVFQNRGHGFLIELAGFLTGKPGVQAFEEAANG